MIFDYYAYIVLPLLIFSARIVDVSIGTIRLIFVSKGLKYLAPILGFFEVFVWIMVIGKLMDGQTHIIIYVAYAAGFAAGNFVGMKIEEKLSIGKVLIRIITQKDAADLLEKLKKNYPITTTDASGKDGPTKIIISVVNKKELPRITKIIRDFNPKAFYTIEEVKFVNDNSYEPSEKKRFLGFYRNRK